MLYTLHISNNWRFLLVSGVCNNSNSYANIMYSPIGRGLAGVRRYFFLSPDLLLWKCKKKEKSPPSLLFLSVLTQSYKQLACAKVHENVNLSPSKLLVPFALYVLSLPIQWQIYNYFFEYDHIVRNLSICFVFLCLFRLLYL